MIRSSIVCKCALYSTVKRLKSLVLSKIVLSTVVLVGVYIRLRITLGRVQLRD